MLTLSTRSVRRLAAALALGAVARAAAGTASAQAAPSQQDITWMNAAHISNMAEIAAGQSAQTRATTDRVRELGAMFEEMHTQLDADLTAAASQLGVTLPTAIPPEVQAQLDQVEAQQGEAYDTAWIAQQTAAHQATLAATQTEVASGSDPTVVALATAATPVVQQHLDELQAPGTASGVPTAVQTGDGGLLDGDDDRSRLLIFGALAAASFAGAAGLTLARRRAR